MALMQKTHALDQFDRAHGAPRFESRFGGRNDSIAERVV
jgi:hypothetical protein